MDCLISGFQTRLFEVEVALDAVHSLVTDHALIAQFEQGYALRSQQLPQEALVGGGVYLDPIFVTTEAGAEAVAAVVVEPTHPLGRVLADPVLHYQFLEARECGLRYFYPALDLLPFPAPVIFEPQRPDQGRQGEALRYKRRQDHREGQEQDKVALRERRPAFGAQRQGESRRQGDHAPHPGPGDDRDRSRGRGGITLAYRAA